MVNNTTVVANATATPFTGGIQILQDLGFFDVVVPFILVFAIIYGVLAKSKILGEKSENLNALVAFSIALLFTATASVTGVIREFLPIIGLISVMIIALLIIVSLFFGDVTKLFAENKWLKSVSIIVIVLAVVWAFSMATTSVTGEPFVGMEVDIMGMIFSYVPAVIVMAFIGLIVYFIWKEPGKGGE
ncbi:MAG: hypothetical protein GOU97_00975 [Nanoarchaeota archaeon]|nr:hypothetical protein [Nanoarchaeota archaeon]